MAHHHRPPHHPSTNLRRATLGVDVDVYDSLVASVRLGDLDEDPSQAGFSDHWFLGAATGAQRHPPEDDTALLLQLCAAPELGFSFLGAGSTLQFRIPEDALAARDWRQIEAIAEA